MEPNTPPKDLRPRASAHDHDAHAEDTQPISRLSLDVVAAAAEGGEAEPADRTDRMSRAALPLGTHGAGSSPDTEPVLRVAAAIEHELRDRRLIAPTLAPTRAPNGIEDVRTQFARGDFAEAFANAAAILARDPSHEEARSYATSCELRLRRRYAARLGSLGRVPRRAAASAAQAEVGAHERALVELIDGRATTEEVIRGSGLAEMEALRLFVFLLDHGLVTLA